MRTLAQMSDAEIVQATGQPPRRVDENCGAYAWRLLTAFDKPSRIAAEMRLAAAAVAVERSGLPEDFATLDPRRTIEPALGQRAWEWLMSRQDGWEEAAAWHRPTVRQWVGARPGWTGRLSTYRHAFAVIDGLVCDALPHTGRRRVLTAWRRTGPADPPTAALVEEAAAEVESWRAARSAERHRQYAAETAGRWRSQAAAAEAASDHVAEALALRHAAAWAGIAENARRRRDALRV